MTRTVIKRTIDAPVSTVFETVANIENFSNAVPEIVDVEFLSEQHRGEGARFRETRRMNGRDATSEFEVTEYVPDDHVRIVSDSAGTVWDTVFTVREQGDRTQLEMVMDARAHRLLSKLINPLMKPVIARAIEKDMDAVKEYCESLAESHS
jgi:carbon monoxide dehydrogenase subunit G